MMLESKKIKWFQNRLLTWAEQNLRDYPWRKTYSAKELSAISTIESNKRVLQEPKLYTQASSNPYHVLVAEFLLQRTDADTVLPIYKAFITRYPTLAELAVADVSEITELLQPLGLFFRAERLSQTAKAITETYNRQIPQEEATLLKLPGIGKYTARAICSQAFDQPLAVLDTNVARIIERFFGIEGKRVKSRCKILWSAADEIAPQSDVGYWNLTLLDFGAKVCIARNPRCTECPLAQKCHWLKFKRPVSHLAKPRKENSLASSLKVN